MNFPYDQDIAHERRYKPNIARKTIAKIAALAVVFSLGTINDRPAFEVASDPTFYSRLAGEIGTAFSEDVLIPIVDVATDTSRW